MKPRSLTSFLFQVLLAATLTGTASASIVTYTLTDAGGYAGPIGFEVVGPLTLSVTADTANIQPSGLSFVKNGYTQFFPGYVVTGSASLIIQGLGTFAITDPITVLDTAIEVEFLDYTADEAITQANGSFAGYFGGSYGTYDLQGPVTVAAEDPGNGSTIVPTTSGPVDFFMSGLVTFTGTPETTTPEPAYTVPTIGLVFLLAMRRFRRQPNPVR